MKIKAEVFFSKIPFSGFFCQKGNFFVYIDYSPVFYVFFTIFNKVYFIMTLKFPVMFFLTPLPAFWWGGGYFKFKVNFGEIVQRLFKPV